jgi:outer membrane receptor for monomeric catechols
MSPNSIPLIPRRIGGVACLAVLGSLRLMSQTTPDTSGTNAPAVLDKIVVEGLPLEETVLPTARPVDSVMGDERSIIDTPRSVSLVTKAQMEARAIARATDFNQYSPGVYTPSRYGLANVPVIRGDLSEIYQNGQRVIYSRNSVLASFNGVEAMDIVKGPGSAVYGPQGNGPGGYVNFVTKLPYFDKFRGEVISRWGSYVPGGQSYFNPEWILDFGGPVNEKLAWRVSYLGREAEGYYQNVKDNTQDIFGALSWRATDKLTVDWNAQFYTSRFNEVIGINRVTQELIDDWTYIAGPVLPNNRFGDPLNSIGQFGLNANFALLNTNLASRVHVYPWQTINAPGDSAGAKKFSSQLIATYLVNDNAKIINRTYGETQESRKASGYGYTEWVPENWMVNNRSEFHFDLFPKLGSYELPIKTLSGIDLRYSSLVSYQDFSIEPFFLYDVTQPASTFRLPFNPAITTFGGSQVLVPDAPGYGSNFFFGNGDQNTEIRQGAIFTQWDIKLHERFSIIAGGRGDVISASARSPEALVGGSLNPSGARYNSSADVFNTSVFVSGLGKFTDKISAYVTYNLVNAIQGSANFGGADGTGGEKGLRRSLSTESQLIEIGSKASLLNNTVFLSFALFDQDRVAPQLVGPPIGINTKGVELEAFYQPNRNFNASANFTYQDATADSRTGQQTGNYLDGFPQGFIVDGQSGTGRGSPNYAYTPILGETRAASVPRVLFNAYFTYQFDSGFGASVGPQVQGSQWQNQEGSLIIPAQYVINAFVFYKQPRWDVQINFFNITDERNWTSIDPGFAGNDVIYPEQPFRISGQVRFKF